MKKIFLTTLGISAILLSGCGLQTATNTASTVKTVKIGVIAPLSGPATALGEDAVNTHKLAADEFNKSHTDIQIQLIIEDGKCDGKDATSAAQKLVNVDHVKIILGGLCSSETLAASKVTEPAGVVLLSSTSSSPEISKIASYTYRYYNDINQAGAMKEYLEKKGLAKIAILYENTDYGVGFAKALTEAMGESNVVVSQKFNTEEKDFSIIAKQVAQKKNDIQAIIYIPNSDNSSINVIRSLDKEGLVKMFKGKIIGAEASYSAATVKELGPLMEDILTTQLPDATSLGQGASTFLQQFKAKYGDAKFADVFLILYKEAFSLVSRGITDPNYGEDKMDNYIKSITKASPTSGLIGSYYFDGVDVVGVNFVVKQVENGKLVATQ